MATQAGIEGLRSEEAVMSAARGHQPQRHTSRSPTVARNAPAEHDKVEPYAVA